jgi:NAD(P)-dependent dehydrogenase (short-subunit alcohol dehydrogenase family)
VSEILSQYIGSPDELFKRDAFELGLERSANLSNDLQGKVALVTGAASGIGKSIADTFAEQGARVFEVDIAFDKRLENRSKTRSKFRADVASSSDVKEAIENLERTYGRLDIAANCAGIEMHGNVVELSEESFDKVMNTNLKSIFLVSKFAIPLILKSTGEGCIINISSDLGIQPIPATDAYSASKGGIIALSKAMSKNWARQGLRVNCIAPGPIDTPLLHRFHDDGTLEFVKSTMIPVGRLGKPEEVASVALFLCSSKASFVNGAVVTVNGGLLG